MLRSSVLNLPAGALAQNEIQKAVEPKAGQGCSSHRRDGGTAPPCPAPGMLKALHAWDCTQELRDDPGMCVR